MTDAPMDKSGLLELRDVFEHPFENEDDPRLQCARVLTLREAEAVLEFRGDLIDRLSHSPAIGEQGAVAWRQTVRERELFGDEINGGFVRDLCYTVWNKARIGYGGEPGDWGTDTLPTVQEGVKRIRAMVAEMCAPPAVACLPDRETVDAIIRDIALAQGTSQSAREAARRAKRAVKRLALSALASTAPQAVKMLVDQDWLNRRMEQDDPDLDCEAPAPKPQADMAVAIKALDEISHANRSASAGYVIDIAAEAIRKLVKA